VNSDELQILRSRLSEAEDALRAIRSGEVDTVVVAGKQGSHVFTLKGADEAYRVLIESMNEGAITVTAEGVILYANQCFARMLKRPLEKVAGSSFYRLLSTPDQGALKALLKRTSRSGSKIQITLRPTIRVELPANLSIRPLSTNRRNSGAFGIVVTDMREARHNEEMLRTLTHRVVQAQEEERGRVALELHDNITQHLCAVLARWQALAATLTKRDASSRTDVMQLNEMLGRTVDEVQRISRNLRPSVLDNLGLVPALRAMCKEFDSRTDLCVTFICKPLIAPLPSDAELALYRILQKAFENVELHSRANHVVVQLSSPDQSVLMTIKDDGIGFYTANHQTRKKDKSNLGLLRMRERAIAVGGTFIVNSAPRSGTEIEVRIPLAPGRTGADEAST
jgi:two-component system NarL family sensor kinase